MENKVEAPSVPTGGAAQEAERLLAKITPVDEHVRLVRYEHGGGRFYRAVLTQEQRYRNEEHRELIADFYGEGDREFYGRAATLVRDLLTELAAVTRQRDEAVKKSALDEAQCDDVTRTAGQVVARMDEARAQLETLEQAMRTTYAPLRTQIEAWADQIATVRARLRDQD